MTAAARANWRIKQLRADKFKGWTIRRLKNQNSGAVFWQTDNNRPPPHRERMSWPTEEKAKLHVEEKNTEERNHGLAAYDIPHAERVEIASVMEQLPAGVTLRDLLSFYRQHNPDTGAATLGDAFSKWIAAQEKDELKPTTIRQNRQRAGVFVRELGEETACAAVTPDRANRFIEARKCGKATRESWKKTLRAFFGFCVESKMCQINPIPAEKRRRGGGGDLAKAIPGFMPPKTVERLMAKVEELHPESVAALAIMFFAGLRPYEVVAQYGIESSETSEARNAVARANQLLADAVKRGGRGEAEARDALAEAREKLAARQAIEAKRHSQSGVVLGGLDWSNVNLAERFIRVLPKTSKTGAGRLVDISDNLLLWLAKYRKASGPVAPSPVTFIRTRRKIMRAEGIKKWLPDVARHTYATMHFAAFENQDKLQAQMGHAGKAYVLTNHYRGLATKAEAEKYWAIEPKSTAQDGRTVQLATAGA